MEQGPQPPAAKLLGTEASRSCNNRSSSLQSHPLPSVDASCCDEAAVEAIRAAGAAAEAATAAAGQADAQEPGQSTSKEQPAVEELQLVRGRDSREPRALAALSG